MKTNYPTVKVLIDKTKKKSDGTYPLYINVTWKYTRAKESTGLSLSEKDFKKGVYKTNRDLKKRLVEIDTNISELMSLNKDFTAKQCLGFVQYKTDPIYVLRDMERLKKIEYNTSRNYIVMINSLKSYFGEDFLLSDLTLPKIQGYARTMNVKPSTMCSYLKKLSALLTYSVERGFLKENVIEKWRFKSDGYKAVDKPKSRSRADVTYYIKVFETTNNKKIKEVIGIWLSGYYFNGLALKDLLSVDWNNIDEVIINNKVYYHFLTNRSKTKEIANIMTPKYSLTEELVEMLKSEPWKRCSLKSYCDYIRRNLKLIDKTLTYYQCRHTFCSMMVQSKNPINTIAAMMGRSVNGISAYIQKISENETLSRAADALQYTEILDNPGDEYFED